MNARASGVPVGGRVILTACSVNSEHNDVPTIEDRYVVVSRFCCQVGSSDISEEAHKQGFIDPSSRTTFCKSSLNLPNKNSNQIGITSNGSKVFSI